MRLLDVSGCTYLFDTNFGMANMWDILALAVV
jgi:hypothetical protein